jgi:DNA replication protein DnaC
MTRLDFSTHGFATVDLSHAEARRHAYNAAAKRKEDDDRRSAFEATIPARYTLANLANWHAPTKEHAKVKRDAEDLAAKIGPAVADGYCLIFAGTIGTGKDHLAIALARVAVAAGFSAVWKHATQIYTQLADCYRKEQSHTDFYEGLTAPQVLIISDPIDERNWTQAKADCFAKVIHRRYSAGRGTWITANLDPDPEAAGQQFAAAVGAEIWDRLLEKRHVFRLYWPSYRTTTDWTKT